jgi:hypothetical protein
MFEMTAPVVYGSFILTDPIFLPTQDLQNYVEKDYT